MLPPEWTFQPASPKVNGGLMDPGMNTNIQAEYMKSKYNVRISIIYMNI